MSEWKYELGEVLYMPERDRILHLKDRFKDVDDGERMYRFVCESNTYEWFYHAEDIENMHVQHITKLEVGYGKARQHELVKLYR